MTTITLTLPEELAEQAKAKDLLSSPAIEELLRKKLFEDEHPEAASGFIGRPPWKLLTREEIQRMHAEMDECRKKAVLPPGVSIADTIREERDAR